MEQILNNVISIFSNHSHGEILSASGIKYNITEAQSKDSELITRYAAILYREKKTYADQQYKDHYKIVENTDDRYKNIILDFQGEFIPMGVRILEPRQGQYQVQFRIELEHV